MLNDKSRPGLRHLKAARRWASLKAGEVVRLPASRIAGGWAAGWHDFYPWVVESFDRDGNAIVRSLANTNNVNPISHRELEYFSEHAPFGHVSRAGGVNWHRTAKRRDGRPTRRFV